MVSRISILAEFVNGVGGFDGYWVNDVRFSLDDCFNVHVVHD